ncbi:MAG: phosphoribosylformylglycinamidine synthase I [Candidatus Baltobacteraceae bacterium]
MAARKVAVLVFPGTNSEDETCRILRAVGLDAHLVHWSCAARLPQYEAFVLPGGFSYEDRIRAGAVAAHDAMLDYVIDAAQNEKLILGICNGAQILLEAGLVPGTGTIRRPTAAFTHNAPVPHFICKHVRVRLNVEPSRSPFTAGMNREEVFPAWAAHGQGRLAATPAHLEELVHGRHVAFVYENGAPNGSALDCAGLLNDAGNVCAIMPHPERDAWSFNHPDRREGGILTPSGGVRFFQSFAQAMERP